MGKDDGHRDNQCLHSVDISKAAFPHGVSLVEANADKDSSLLPYRVRPPLSAELAAPAGSCEFLGWRWLDRIM